MSITLADYTFRRIAQLQPERAPAGDIATFRPQVKLPNDTPLHAWGDLTYCRIRADVPAEAGVYVITVDDRPRYVGRTVDLRQATNYQIGNISPSDCKYNGQPTNCRLNHAIYRAAVAGQRVDLWFHPTPDGEAVKRTVLQAGSFAWNLS